MKVMLGLLGTGASGAVYAASGEAGARKARSLTILKAEGVPFIEHLPVIETVAESTRRRPAEVLHRAIALAIVAAKGHTGDAAFAYELIERFGAEGFFSPWEQAFIDDPNPDGQSVASSVWRYEGAHVMLWAMGLASDLDRPERNVDVSKLAKTIQNVDMAEWEASGQLRPQEEILDAADLIYRYHWAVVNARLAGEQSPSGLDAGIVYERHYALNWLIGYGHQAWDDVSTDT